MEKATKQCAHCILEFGGHSVDAKMKYFERTIVVLKKELEHSKTVS